MVTRVLLSLLMTAAFRADAASVIQSLRPLRELAIVARTDTPLVSYARDDLFEYLGLQDGLYRAARIAGAPLERIALAGQTINVVMVHNGELYVSRGLPNFSVWNEPALLRSRDHGVTFEPIAAGLETCVAGSDCGWMIPRQLAFAPGRLFVSAGGNVLASSNDGATWAILFGVSGSGKPEPQVCPATFERIGERMIIGGECPLDTGFLAPGILRPDLLGWASEPVRLQTPEMENRNVQFIRGVGGGVLYAGIEGAVMKSTDGGATFRYVLHYGISDSGTYPYIGQLVASSRHPGLIVIGGFDKANFRGWLAYSPNAGESWIDASSLVANTEIVSLLAEDVDGRLLAITYSEGRFVISELVIATFGKRRSVR